MAIRTRGIQQTLSTLSRINRRSTEGARAAIDLGARRIRDRARGYAPFKTGALESGIRVRRRGGDTSQSYSVSILVQGSAKSYSQIIHEWAGNWGAGTRAKDAGRGVVGAQYLARAAEELYPSIQRSVSAALAPIGGRF